MAKLLESKSSGRRARRGPAKTSLRRQRHLSGHEQVDLSSVVFIVGQALVNLRSGKLREAVCPQRVNRFAILKQADDIVDGNPQSGYLLSRARFEQRGIYAAKGRPDFAAPKNNSPNTTTGMNTSPASSKWERTTSSPCSTAITMFVSSRNLTYHSLESTC